MDLEISSPQFDVEADETQEFDIELSTVVGVALAVSAPPISFDIEIGAPVVDVESGDSAETVALVIVRGAAGATGAGVIGDSLTGVRDGVNTVFTTVRSFIPGSTAVYLNGLRELAYAESGSHTIVFDDAPYSGDMLTIDYFI